MVQHGLVQIGGNNPDALSERTHQRACDDPGTGGYFQHASHIESRQPVGEVLSVRLEKQRAEIFVSGDSVTRAKLHSVWPRALRLGRPRSDPIAAQTVLLEAISRRAAEFDVIHAHIDWLHLPLLDRLGVPFVTTMHGRLDLPGLPDVVSRFPSAPFLSISNHQRTPLGEANWLGTVYHGLPADLFRPSFEAGTYLAFLGRLTAEKGPEAAIGIARAAGMPLRIAAKVPRGERRYFKERLEPQIDGDQIRLIGEVDDGAKQKFLADASALLFPIDWPEPFGLVMIEAMACGTPVIAFRSGSVAEVVDDGVTGFVVDGEAKAIRRPSGSANSTGGRYVRVSSSALQRSGWRKTTFVIMKGWWRLDPHRSAVRLLRRLCRRNDRSQLRHRPCF